MNINIYYGGRGIIDDPTAIVIKKMTQVLEELRVNVTRYNLYEQKSAIVSLPQTLKDADGIILATTVEWYGVGGYMQQFLDACWLYGDKEKISKTYMCPIVMSTTYGEREAKLQLATAWEILGGLPCSGICGYIDNVAKMETNRDFMSLIEKKAENMYRTISQHLPSFPASVQAVRQKVSIPQSTNLSQKESEVLSELVADDVYVKRQKEDIQELTDMFKGLMSGERDGNLEEFLGEFNHAFKPQAGVKATYSINMEEKAKNLYIRVDGKNMQIEYSEEENADVMIKAKRNIIEDIVHGRLTFQGAFMSGKITNKGDFVRLRVLDQIFNFNTQA